MLCSDLDQVSNSKVKVKAELAKNPCLDLIFSPLGPIYMAHALPKVPLVNGCVVTLNDVTKSRVKSEHSIFFFIASLLSPYPYMAHASD